MSYLSFSMEIHFGELQDMIKIVRGNYCKIAQWKKCGWQGENGILYITPRVSYTILRRSRYIGRVNLHCTSCPWACLVD